MDKVQLTDREYPHIVETGLDRNTHMRVDLFVDLQGDDVERMLRAFGMLQDTPPNEAQRLLLINYVCRHTTRSNTSHCIVWSPTSCTYVSANGPAVDGDRPPVADHCDARDYDRVPFRTVDCTIIALPEGRYNEYLSVRLLDAEHVEVSSASPAMIGYLDETPTFGTDPILPFLDADGDFVPPTHFRGVKVTGVREGPILLGPIQPDGTIRHVVRRWPADVWDACRKVAEGTLPKETLLAAWHAIAPSSDTLNLVGVRMAA